MSSSISSRLKARKSLAEKIMRRGNGPSISKYVEVDTTTTESGSEGKTATRERSQKKRISKDEKKRSPDVKKKEKGRINTCRSDKTLINSGVKRKIIKNKRRSEKMMHFGLKIGYLKHDKDDTEIGENSFYTDNDDYPDEAESKDGVLPQATNACNSWKQVADGIELLVKGKTCARMVCKSNLQEDNNFTSIRESEKHVEIVKLGETEACGLRTTSKSKSRTNQLNATISPEESDEQGLKDHIEHDKDETETGKKPFYSFSNNYLDRYADEVEILDRTANAGNNRKQLADKFEGLVKTKASERINCESKSRNKRKKNFTGIEESGKGGSNLSDSDRSDDIVILGETKAFSMNLNSPDKNAIIPEEIDEQGIAIKDQLKLNRTKKTDEYQRKQLHGVSSDRQGAERVRDQNGGDDHSSYSCEWISSKSRRRFEKPLSPNKNISVPHEEEGVRFFSREAIKKQSNAQCKINSGMASWDPLKNGAVEKPSEEISSDCLRDSLSSSDTEYDDSDDEDFNIETYISSISEDSVSSFPDEGDEEDSILWEAIEENSTEGDEENSISWEAIEENSAEQGHEKIIVDEHVLTRESSSTKRQMNVPISQGISEGGNKNKVLGMNADTEQQTDNSFSVAVEEPECSGKRASKKAEDFRKLKKSKLVQSEKESAREMVNKPNYKEHSRAGMKKQKKTCINEGDKISKQKQADGKTSDVVVDRISDERKVATSKVNAERSTGSKNTTMDVDNDMRSRIEDPHPRLKRRKTSCCGTDTHENSTEFPDQTGFQLNCHRTNKHKEKCMDKEIEQLAKIEQHSLPKQNYILKVLISSIWGKGEVFKEQACEEEPKQSSLNKFTLPLKFRFEDEEQKPVEKPDHEKMVEGLFSEMNFLMYDDMNSFDSPEVDTETQNTSLVNDNEMHACCEGGHDFIDHDEIGEICRNCQHVEREWKDIIEWPEFAKNHRQEMGMSRFFDSEQLSVFNGLNFTPAVNNFGASVNAMNGTVWDIIPGVRETMYQHQQEGFEFLWKSLKGTIDLTELKNPDSSGNGGCIISHAPGTGKTRLTIVFMLTYLKLFPSSLPVIIAPASMLLTWEEEFRKWQVDFPFHNLNNLEFSGKEQKKLLEIVTANKCPHKDMVRAVKIYSWSKETSILGLSYNLYSKLVGEGRKKGPKRPLDEQSEKLRKILLQMPGLVVFDEGHTPRSQSSCIWNTLVKLQTEKRIILSGTPFQNNFLELFNTLRLVRPKTAGFLAKERTFSGMINRRGMYSKEKFKENGTSLIFEKGVEELKAVISPFVHVHKGSILQKKLPGLKDCVVLLDPPSQQKSLIKKIEGTGSIFEYDHKVALISVHPSLLEHCSLADIDRSGTDQHVLKKLRLHPREGVKTRFILELVRLSRDKNEKVLVFSQYIEPLRLIKDQLKAIFHYDEGKELFWMRGGLEQKSRQIMINEFNDPKSKAFIFLASTKCCSEGISLIGASRIVLLDVVWNPSVERQAISRAYRLGQKKVVYTYHLLTAGTTEGEKYCRQAEKDRLSDLVFSSSTKENEKRKSPASAFGDSILEEMLGHPDLQDMFEKVIYQPKEANLMESFGFAPLI